MQRSTLVALPLCLLFLPPACFQARASPIPRNFQPLKNSPSGCLTVIFFLVLLLTILFIFKKIYVARRRNIDPVWTFSDEYSTPKFNWKRGKSMTKAIAKKSGFYVGLLGSPDWETKHYVSSGGGPRHIFSQPESRTPKCRRFLFGSLTTTILHKIPPQCEITSTRRLVRSNLLRDKPQLLNVVVLPPEISRPPSAMVPPEHPSLCFDTKSSFPARRLSSPLTTQNGQRGDFQSNENITFNSGPKKSVLVSGLDSLQSRTDHFNMSRVSSFTDFKDERHFSSADTTIPTQTFRTLMKHSGLPTPLFENSIEQVTIKPLHFGKRLARNMSEKSQQIYADNANNSILETPVQDFSAVSPPRASYKTPNLPKSCIRSVALSSSSVWLKPRCSIPIRRTRNNPIIGPSPLRTMSLPSDYDSEHTRKFNNRNMSSKIQSEAKFEPELESPSSSHSSPIFKRTETGFHADNPDVILDLIRELAQESSAWDASLFVDANFKALIDQSATYRNSKLKVQIAPEKQSKYCRKQHHVTLQDIPESDVAVVFSEEHDNWHSDKAQSFWEDKINSAYQYDTQPEPSSSHVGRI